MLGRATFATSMTFWVPLGFLGCAKCLSSQVAAQYPTLREWQVWLMVGALGSFVLAFFGRVCFGCDKELGIIVLQGSFRPFFLLFQVSVASSISWRPTVPLQRVHSVWCPRVFLVTCILTSQFLGTLVTSQAMHAEDLWRKSFGLGFGRLFQSVWHFCCLVPTRHLGNRIGEMGEIGEMVNFQALQPWILDSIWFQDLSKWCPEKANELIARMVVLISCNSSYCSTCVWGASSISCSRRIHRCVWVAFFFESAKELCAEGPADLPKSQAVAETSAYGTFWILNFCEWSARQCCHWKRKGARLKQLVGEVKCTSSVCSCDTSFCGNKFHHLFRRFLQWFQEAALKFLDEGLLAHRAGRSVCPRPCQTSPRCRCDGLVCQCRPA